MSDFIEEIERAKEEAERASFQIDNLETLGWAFRKLSALQAKEQEIKEYEKAEIFRIKSWAAKETNKLDDDIQFFQSHIERYHFRKLQEDPKAKTLSTPYGKSKSTTSKPSPQSVDDTALLEHIKSNGFTDYLKVEESVKWGDFKKRIQITETDDGFAAFDENGEKIPGVIVKPENISFKSEVEK
ncbi:Bacteriophage Mu Gam like protein [Planococcus massiliensis]|uniref:Bacteriophage Mu Gam like protein n=1 Tax=Planococcus massiliensis TaxID=1499687 RepID=A0A098EPD2_9BACL|nr:host-nuclease inhibitor Gam family protein [Planococcus massiliensis]CEG23161.1 Bacteriophage Mu Gam like protein [Planococcus massiliensis]